MHLFLADVDPASVAKLGSDPQRAVGAAGVLVDLRDLAGEPACRSVLGEGGRSLQA